MNDQIITPTPDAPAGASHIVFIEHDNWPEELLPQPVPVRIESIPTAIRRRKIANGVRHSPLND